MKYLFAVFSIVVLSSMVTLYFLWPTDPVIQKDIALTVNGHPIFQEEIDAERHKQCYHSENPNSFVDALVTRQLLIDEAQRLRIDKKPAFSRALKNYYEQSLINTLTEHVLKSVSVEVSEDDVDRYLSSSGKIFTFTRIPVEKGKPLKEQSQQKNMAFDDLSGALRLILAGLQPGEEVVRFETGTEVCIIQLDTVENAIGFMPVTYQRSRVHELLGQYRRSLELDLWINTLRKKASIVEYGEVETNE